MGMHTSVEIIDPTVTKNEFKKIFSYFNYIDQKFSTYKKTSEINSINTREIKESEYSEDMKIVLELSEKTKKETQGYFDICSKDKILDPSGLVKGWSIYNAAEILKKDGFDNFCIDIGGDVQVNGKNNDDLPWKIGIRNPFHPEKEIVKVVFLRTEGLATSGTYARGQHIYNPLKKDEMLTEFVSLSVIGPNIYEADRFATAAFAMGREGIDFIERLEGFEGYLIDKNGIAIMSSNFEKYTQKYA